MADYTFKALVYKQKKISKIIGMFVPRTKPNAYYTARHNTKDVEILWIEAQRFGSVIAFPAAIKVGEKSCVYVHGRENKKENDELMRLWRENVDSQLFEEQYTFKTINQQEFCVAREKMMGIWE